ncbi:MAG: YlbE-like family protein [Sporolactobacillus sp.]|jgi:hypothetical protein|nr:YlbE-like family protein [Sporolactobacillus sp.]
MRKEIQRYLDGHPDEKVFVRLHPEWYRTLSRRPQAIAGLKQAADLFYGRTFGQKLDRFGEQAGMLSMLAGMAQAMTAGKGGTPPEG